LIDELAYVKAHKPAREMKRGIITRLWYDDRLTGRPLLTHQPKLCAAIRASRRACSWRRCHGQPVDDLFLSHDQNGQKKFLTLESTRWGRKYLR